jgi:hypothetical protein
MELQLIVAKEHNWKSNFVMCLVMQPLLALATLGDADDRNDSIRVPLPKVAKASKALYLWYKTADSFANKLCQLNHSFLSLRNTAGKMCLIMQQTCLGHLG